MAFCIAPQAIASSLKICSKTFSKCRKFEDDSITVLSACTTNPAQLKQKVKLKVQNEKSKKLYPGCQSPGQC